MIKIGAINIDVSHPLAFSAVLHDSERARYTAVFNDGFREFDEVEGFAKKENLQICSTLDELADMVDVGFVHSCDWDKHIDYAMPFIKRNKPVFIDKPIVGNMKDLERFLDLCEKGAKIIGTSALRYCQEVEDACKKLEELEAVPLHTVVTSGTDEFNYAIHAVEEICGINSAEPVSCRYVSGSSAGSVSCENYFIEFDNGTTAQYISAKGKFMKFNTIVTLSSPKPVTDLCFVVDNSKFYGAMLDRVCDYMEGDTTKLASPQQMASAIKIMLAGKASKLNGGITVPLDSPLLYEVSFDGHKFAEEYGSRQGKIYI